MNEQLTEQQIEQLRRLIVEQIDYLVPREAEIDALCDLALSALRRAEPYGWHCTWGHDEPQELLILNNGDKAEADDLEVARAATFPLIPLFASPPAESAEARALEIEYKPDGYLLAEVQRREDMSANGYLKLLLQQDGDIIGTVYAPDHDGLLHAESVEFCASGGHSPNTLQALRGLIAAMQEDNKEHPLAARSAR